MRVVGIDAKQLLADDGIQPLYYTTNSVTLSRRHVGRRHPRHQRPGSPRATYYLYAANLQYLANNDEPGLGGMMTKIVIESTRRVRRKK